MRIGIHGVGLGLALLAMACSARPQQGAPPVVDPSDTAPVSYRGLGPELDPGLETSYTRELKSRLEGQPVRPTEDERRNKEKQDVSRSVDELYD